MKKLLIVGLTSAVLFGVSGTASWYLQYQQQHEHPAPSTKTLMTGTKSDTPHTSTTTGSHADEPMVPAVRPTDNPGADEIARLTAELRTRVAAARENERLTAARKKELELIQQDLHGERAAIDDLQKQVKKELESVHAALAEMEKQGASVKNDQGKVNKAAQDLESQSLRLQKEEQDNLKKMSLMYNNMPPESAAKIMRSLADTGKMDTAVKVLGMMQEKQAAKVLAELGDAGLAVQMLERLKGLRKPGASGAGPDLR